MIENRTFMNEESSYSEWDNIKSLLTYVFIMYPHSNDEVKKGKNRTLLEIYNHVI